MLVALAAKLNYRRITPNSSTRVTEDLQRWAKLAERSNSPVGKKGRCLKSIMVESMYLFLVKSESGQSFKKVAGKHVRQHGEIVVTTMRKKRDREYLLKKIEI